MIRFKFVSLLLFSFLIFSSCSLERKLAMEFIKKKEHKGAVMLVQPYFLNMYNNNEYILDSVILPKDFPLDSLLFQQTNLLKQISDSIFLENYLNGFINSLRQNGFQVFLPDELDAFRDVETPAYIFKFAQMELSEEIYPYSFSEEISGTNYHKSFDLNLINLSNWFEFEARDTAWRKVFYAEDYIMDEINGNISMDENKNTPVLFYVIDSLSVNNVYQMATDVGKKYAGFLTNYLMNSYINQHFPANLRPNIMFRYDADLRLLFPYEEGFQEISLAK